MMRVNLRVLVLAAAVAAGGTMLAAYAGVPAAQADHVPDPDTTDVFMPPHYIGEIDLPYGVRLGSVAVNTTHIFAVDPANHRVRIFTMSGNDADTIGSYGAGPGHFNNPSGIALNATHIFVTDMYNHRVQIFDMSGNYAGEFGSYGGEYDQFRYPTGITISADIVYVLDSINNRVQIFDHAGNGLGTRVNGIGLGGSNDIAVGTDHIFVTARTDEVKRYDLRGDGLNSYGRYGDGPGGFRDTAGLALTPTHIFVADTYNSRIQILGITDGRWEYVDEFGRYGPGPGEFRAPTGIALSPTYMFVTDLHDDRIQIFTLPYIRTTGP